jgi:hypothetical protein
MGGEEVSRYPALPSPVTGAFRAASRHIPAAGRGARVAAGHDAEGETDTRSDAATNPHGFARPVAGNW